MIQKIISKRNLKMIEYENLAKLNSSFFEDYKQIFSEILDSGWYVLGENVSKFEEEFAGYNGVSHCVGVASGLDAIRLSLKALDLPRGSEILVASNTYIATILPIIEFGYIPILVEPEINTYNISPNEMAKKITPKTSGIIITHLYGKPCDMDPILEIVKKNNLRLIEDCAQAHGAEYKGKKVGSFGDFGCFSFYPTKNLGGLGEGGAITTNNPKLAKTINWLRNYGSNKKYYNEIIGYNSRIDEVQTGFLRVKLKKLDEINAHKRKLAEIYDKGITNNKVIKPAIQVGFLDVFHIYNIRHPKRNELKEYLEKKGIGTAIHYPVPPHKQNATKGLIKGSFPISEEIHNTTLSLPISYFHTEEEILKVIDAINSFEN
jgi:dTDP-4-amino-4,6-dideoxygalactose transaminase